MKDLRITSETIKPVQGVNILGGRYLIRSDRTMHTGREEPGAAPTKVPASLSVNTLTLRQRMAMKVGRMQITRAEAMRVGYRQEEIDELLPEREEEQPAIVLPAQLNETVTRSERRATDWLAREAEIQNANGVKTV